MNIDDPSKQEFLTRLKASQSEKEWNAICDEVKAHTKTLPKSYQAGDYPWWWFDDVILSGLSSKVFA